mmetsp:Transcript_26602/g.47817  ORF Transcript_26602/g.47817 Transcript_26602/m.47817 type:complete len:444 (-) Transcript_26602:3139-4470(-)
MPRICSRCGNDMDYGKDLDSNIADFFGQEQFLSEDDFELKIMSKPCLPERLLQSLLNCLPHVFDKVLINEERLHCGGLQTETHFADVSLNARHTNLTVIGESLCFFDSEAGKVPFKVVISRGLFLEQKSKGNFTLKFRNCVYKVCLNSDQNCDSLTEQLIKANSFRNFTDDYVELHEIGAGGYGKVILARHLQSSRFVAVKVVEKDLSLSQEIRLQNEVTVMSMANHSNIVQLLDLYEDLKHLYLVMEYLAYGSALEWITKAASPIKKCKIIELLKQIASAAAYLHSCGIVHRDIKLTNILVCNLEATKFKLIDFGLACFIGPGQVARGCVGSIRYVPPEMYLGRCYREEVDSWSFGVMAYFSLTQSFPFEGSDLEHQVISCDPDWTNKKLDRSSIGLLKQLMAKHPKQRLQLTEMLDTSMLDDLETCESPPEFHVRPSPFRP